MTTIKNLVFAAILASLAMLPITPMVSASANTSQVVTLTSSNTVVLGEEVSGESVAAVIEKVKTLDSASLVERTGFANKKPIYLFLFTPGGSVQSGLELVEALHGLNRPVNTVTAFAASMGFQIVQSMGDRLILKSGVLMSHHATGGTEGEIGGAGVAQANNRLGLWERRLLEMDNQTVERTKGKQTLTSYQAAYDHELWLTGNEAVAQGYADKVVTVKCDKTLDGYTTHHTTIMGIIPVSYDISDCPLSMTPVHIKVQLPTNVGPIEMNDFASINGGFGVTCFQLLAKDPTKVCAIDTSLTMDKLVLAKASFVDRFSNIQNHVVPLSAR